MIPLSTPVDFQAATARTMPRVRLTYKVDTGLGPDEVELPFVIGIIGDLAPHPPEGETTQRHLSFIDIQGGGVDSALAELVPCLILPDAGFPPVTLYFRSLNDFSPDGIAAQVPGLRRLLIERSLLADARRAWTTPPNPALIARRAEMAALPSLPRLAQEEVPVLAAMLVPLLTEMAAAADPAAEMAARIAALDLILERRTAAIRLQPSFRQLEASWRGVDFLARTVSSREVVVRVLALTRENIVDDLEGASTLERTELYRLTYTREYGILGGRPFGLICLDMEFGSGRQDCWLLDRLSLLGSHIHAPVIANAAPGLLGCAAEMAEIADGRRDLSLGLQQLEQQQAWAQLRRADHSRYLALALPRVLAADIGPAPFGQGRGFVAGARGAGAAPPLWMGAIYPFAQVAAASFIRNGWSVAITGIDGGGRVDGLPAACFSTGERGRATRPGLEALLTEAQENLLADAGLLPLLHCQGQPYAAFFRVQSVHLPHRAGARPGLEERMQVRLSLVFAICRIAHYLKVLTRETVGTLAAARDLEARLNRWIAGYVAFQDDTAPEIRARRPLRHGSVRVEQREGEPGVFNLAITIQPHFQFDELDCSISLTSRLEVSGLSTGQTPDRLEETARGP